VRSAVEPAAEHSEPRAGSRVGGEPVDHILDRVGRKGVDEAQQLVRGVPNAVLGIPGNEDDRPAGDRVLSPIQDDDPTPLEDVVDLGLGVPVPSEPAGGRSSARPV